MYTPEAFTESRLPILHHAINSCGLSIFITAGPGAPSATHVPMLLDAREGPHGTLHFHLARGNPQWRDATPGTRALAIFPGPDGYVSPSWYASKAEHGRVVPTWNYVTVHAEGEVEFYHEPDRLRALVSQLTDHHEGKRAAPWKLADAPASYTETQLRGIVGVALRMTRLQGQWKLGQNKNAADRAGLLAGYSSEGADYGPLAAITRDTGV